MLWTSQTYFTPLMENGLQLAAALEMSWKGCGAEEKKHSKRQPLLPWEMEPDLEKQIALLLMAF